jgi:nitroreductase
MSDLDILRKIPDTGYREPAPTHDVKEFYNLVHARRSVRVFLDTPNEDSVIEKCLELALLAPNSSNLQPWEFYWIKDRNKLEKLRNYCLGQSAARTAPTLIVAVAKTNTWDRNRKKMLELFDQQDPKPPKGAYTYYKKVAPMAYYLGLFNWFGFLKKVLSFFQRIMGKVVPHAPTSYCDMRVWAHKTCALACENLMLALRAHGLDSCPMEGLDPHKIKKLLKLDSRSEITMVIGAGKRAPNGIFSKRVRFDSQLFIKKI